FFFFQAEDGIRDRNVTGVQTCALPISLYREFWISKCSSESGTAIAKLCRKCWRDLLLMWCIFMDWIFWIICRLPVYRSYSLCIRSEERRVGKECRCWGRACC